MLRFVTSPQLMLTMRLKTSLCLSFAVLTLIACSPKYNWREVHGKDAPFIVLFPDKPVSVTRSINLNGEQVNMTMTAAEVDGVSFAVGYTTLADAAHATAAVDAMKTALLHNINGKQKTDPNAANDIEALGSRDSGNGNEPLLLLGHFAAKGNRAYQVIVLGNEKAVLRDEAHTFLTSFKPE